MADSSEPRQVTVHITVPPQQKSSPAAPAPETTIRIVRPTRPQTNSFSAPAHSPSPTSAATAALPTSLRTATPQKETVQITDLANRPATEKPAAAGTVTPEPQPQARIDNIPIWLCWALLAASVTILILQIWNYFS